MMMVLHMFLFLLLVCLLLSLARLVLPLLVVDNSAFPPKRLTIPLGPDYPS